MHGPAGVCCAALPSDPRLGEGGDTAHLITIRPSVRLGEGSISLHTRVEYCTRVLTTALRDAAGKAVQGKGLSYVSPFPSLTG